MVTLTPNEDNAVEGTETATSTLDPGGTAYLVGSPAGATISIADDPPMVTLTAIDSTARCRALPPPPRVAVPLADGGRLRQDCER